MVNGEIRKINLAYKNMLSRCDNPKNSGFHHYGGRGISVCREWRENRENFVNWALNNGHDMHLSLDRINNDGNYEPSNCRWATIQQQLSNQRRNRLITHYGTTKTISEMARSLNIKEDTLFRRINKYKMSPEKALLSGRVNPWRHGTRQGYEFHKCKCDLCRESNNKRHRDRRTIKSAVTVA